MRNIKYLFSIALLGLITACEEEIVVDTSAVSPSIVVDAFVTHQAADQYINITLSKPFYDTGAYTGVGGVDTVYIENLSTPSEPPYIFVQEEDTRYVWQRLNPTDSFGIMGDTYRLTVGIGSLTIQALSTLHPVPTVDSIRYNYEDGSAFIAEGYDAEFFATDLEGIGNTYWIKGFKNGVFLDKPPYITTSFDGSFSEGDQDAILFIPPIRSAINPIEDLDNEAGIDAPYLVGDSASVELHGITREAFLYLNEIRTQTDRQGGISELFSVPVTNLTGNLTASDGQPILGFFSVSSVSTLGLALTSELALEAIERAQ